MATPPIGVLGALPEEVAALEQHLELDRVVEAGRRRYLVGRLFGVSVVLLHARIGKVAAASTATHLIGEFDARALVFTGVAGAVAEGVQVGDLVVAENLAQHDLDASPIFPAMEIPLLGCTEIEADPRIVKELFEAAQACERDEVPHVLAGSSDRPPSAHLGQIISGDRFVSTSAEVQRLRERCPKALCVEMEGAAVAQVAYEHGVPFGVVRAISDSADDDATEHFSASFAELGAAASLGVLRRALPGIARSLELG